MQFGVLLPQFGALARGAEVTRRIRAVAQTAEHLGYDVLWTAEHIIFPQTITTPYPYGGRFPYPLTDPILGIVATLSYVAAITARIKLGSSVLVLPYRNPIVLAKELASLDVLSNGRLLLGIAAGWLQEEFDMLGVPFHERGRRTDESVTLLRALWTQERVTFRGSRFDLTEAAFFPKPVQQPHPPIWIGGGSPAALRRVGRLGDGWMAVPRPTLDDLACDIGEIRRCAGRAGRDPASLGIASSGGASSIDDLLDRLPRLEKIGVTITTVPVLFWARSFPHALELMEEFAQRARLPAR
ncbi:MAG TPA: LLM class F420-dependent oxidoreductase [Candidatus Margulisiibacteriota bacterium]|nr:LLM class F420-dependent oxidoreductase [Candidatus Margulisiibacteriota bacterium]